MKVLMLASLGVAVLFGSAFVRNHSEPSLWRLELARSGQIYVLDHDLTKEDCVAEAHVVLQTNAYVECALQTTED